MRWRVPLKSNGRSKANFGFSRYALSCTHARWAMEPRFGMRAGVEGSRKRIPVTWVAVVVMPSVANEVRMQAWKALTAWVSGIGALAGETPDAREERCGDLQS